MKNTKIQKIMCLFVVLLLSLASLASCNKVDEDTTQDTEQDISESTSDSVAETSDTEASSSIELTTEQTTDQTTESSKDPYGREEYKVDANWYGGYVGSSSNTAHANKLNTSGEYYSYSDIIDLGPSGTTISFTDDNTNSNGDSQFADRMVYVFSTWKNENGVWELDRDGYCANGYKAQQTGHFGATTYTYTSKSDNERIRLCFRSGQTDEFTPEAYPDIIVMSTQEPTVEKSARTDEENTVEWIKNDKERAYFDVLKGKSITVIGDSYLAGNGLNKKLVWSSLLAQKYDMSYKNFGVNGSTMSNYVTTYNPMVDRYESVVSTSSDIIILEGGRNDYNRSVPIGDDESMDTTTMKGAARYLITQLREKCPNALIIGFTVWEVGGSANSAGHFCSDYGRAFIDVCKDMGVPYIDAMDQSLTGVYMTDPDFRLEYCMKPTDISHLNAKGMKLVFPVFERLIAEYYSDAVADK